MADQVKISALPAGTVPIDTEVFPMVQSGVTNKVTKLQMFTNPNIPATSSSFVGVINQNAHSFIHTYGSGNLFMGEDAGNFTLNTGIAFRNIRYGASKCKALLIRES